LAGVSSLPNLRNTQLNKMSKISIRLFSLFMFSAMLVNVRQNVYAQEVVASYQTFYDQMSPYGQWVNDAQYGDVWVPNAEAGYRPYATNGHWAMTDYGNMWVSDEPYGWACYHYGRWTYNPYYGWVWIPGHEWAPAWVSWRSGNGFYGWAPMEPGFEAGGSYQCPDNYWVFVSPDYLYHPNVYSYYDATRNYYYCQHTVYIHDTYNDHGMVYNYGPRREVIEREAHQPVQVYRVSTVGRPGGTRESGGVVQIYRPEVKAESQRTSRPANVVQARQPVGRGQDIPGGKETAQPAFRQQMQQHPASYPGTTGQRGNTQQPAAPGQNRGNIPQGQQQTNRPQPQHFQQQENVQQNQVNRQQQFNQASQGQQNMQRSNQQPASQNNQPQNTQRFNQQPVRSIQQPHPDVQPTRNTLQAQPQMQQQRPQPQAQPQQARPQPQARPQGAPQEEGRRR